MDITELNPDQFVFRECTLGGDACMLIFPKEIGVEWTLDTLHFRSIILRKSDLKVVSIGQLKFTNLGEKPHLYPDPNLFTDWIIWDKMDGSLCIVSRHNGELICRTRGVSSILVHPDGQDVLDLVARYGVVNHPLLDGHSLLFEHLSTTRPIVLRYDQSDLVLLDIVRHSDLRYLPVAEVDAVAAELGCRRPERFTFNSLDEIVQTCLHLKGKEGFVLAYNGNQNRVKIKATDYLLRARLKSEVGSISKVLDLYVAHLDNEPLRTKLFAPQSFYDYIARTFDFEIAEQVKPMIARIQIAHSQVEATVADVTAWVATLTGLSRKDQALAIIARYGETSSKGIAFLVLDKKPIPTKTLRALIENRLDTP